MESVSVEVNAAIASGDLSRLARVMIEEAIIAKVRCQLSDLHDFRVGSHARRSLLVSQLEDNR